MANITDHIGHDLEINQHTQLFGSVKGKVTVLPGFSLQVHGKIEGTLLLKKDSEVFLHGMVQGDIINEGGKLTVFGMVRGTVYKNGGHTKIMSQAIVEKLS